MVTPQQALEYFTKEKPSILKAIFIGVVGILFGLSLLIKGHTFWGIAIIVIAILAMYGLKDMLAKYPTDEAIDSSFAQLMDIKRNEAIKKLDLQQDEMVREPLSILGVGKFDYEKEGEDGVTRYNPLILEIVFFGKKQLIVNEVSLDLINQGEYKARTNEFFYQDVSAVSVYDDDDGKKFAIKVHGQTECDISISDSNIELAEEAVKSIRKVLRETKA